MIYQMDCKDYFARLCDVDIIITDPPYNLSTDGANFDLRGRKPIQRDFGDWDKMYDPGPFIDMAAKSLADGGWLIIWTGDRLFGRYHALIKDHPDLSYRTTLTWCKTNPAPNVRRRNWTYAFEWVAVASKGKPNTFHFLSDAEMKNYIVGTTCSHHERVHWHSVDGEIALCQKGCHICKTGGIQTRKAHPTQKPMYVWEWILRVISDPGQTAYDPYAGVGSSGAAAEKYGLEWVGTEINPEYATVGNLWLSNIQPRTEYAQISLF